jgi:hypothetical protein
MFNIAQAPTQPPMLLISAKEKPWWGEDFLGRIEIKVWSSIWLRALFSVSKSLYVGIICVSYLVSCTSSCRVIFASHNCNFTFV